MRHYKKGRKLGTDASHTKAMKKSLLVAIFTNDRIKTVESRAKEIRSEVDRVITWAKKGDLHSRRRRHRHLPGRRPGVRPAVLHPLLRLPRGDHFRRSGIPGLT